MIWWYPNLTFNHENGLLRNVKTTDDYIIICHQGEEYRKFAMFTPLYSFATFLLKQSEKNRCYYEVIQGHVNQKPYFDIDIDVNQDNSIGLEDSKKLIEDITESILEDKRIKKSDIMIFSSHGPSKYSYHIVINNWCLPDYYSNKVYCNKVIDRVKNVNKKYIDDVMYKSIQQFRTYGSTKFGKERFKILESEHPNLTVNNARCTFINILYSSLITNTKYCRILEFTEQIKKKYNFVDDDDITEEQYQIVCNLPYILDETFSIKETQGKLIILLRNRSSFCEKCEREHETENPFMIFEDNDTLSFHCRRQKNDRQVIWKREAAPIAVKTKLKKEDFLKKFLGKA